MRRDAAFSRVLQFCKSLCLPTQSAPGMFGAFCSASFSSGQALPLTEPALAAATRQFSHILCASNTKAPKTLSRTAAIQKPLKRSLHTADLPVAEQQATVSQQDTSTSQFVSVTDAAAESSSQASSSPHRTAKLTYRKAKEGPKEPSTSTDLRCVNGVGPKNEALLLKVGLSSVDRLKDMYKVDHNCDTSALKAYLQEKAGIRKHHCTVIVSDIKQKVDEETAAEGGASPSKPNRRVTLCMEGNISAGKSTFLRWVASGNPELEDILEVVPEPVDKWQDIGNGHHNVLQAFYDTPDRYAYTFQNYVFVTRMMQEKETQSGDRPFRLLERSVFSDRMVFVRAVHEKAWMSDLELNIYDSWFEPVVAASPSLIPDGFIYLRATPKICMDRMLKRQRSEETGVTLDYLTGIHQKHEDWLLTNNDGMGGMSADLGSPLSASAWTHQGQSLPAALRAQLGSSQAGTLKLQAVEEPPEIQGKVLYLNSRSRPDMPKFIEGVPTLVLDYDKHIDMSRDLDAKQFYATQVKAYFGFVKALRDKKAEDVRLSPFTGNLSQGNLQKATPDQVALMKRVMHSMQGECSDEDRAFLQRMYDITVNENKPLFAGAV